jgi:kynurenine formamidase
MKAKCGRKISTIVFAALLLGVAAEGLAQQAPPGNNPVDQKWWPSEFGANDQAGATNWITAESRIAAAKLVKRGIVATLGMPYHARMPLFPGRTWALSIPGGGTPTHDLPWGDPGTRQTFMDELLTAEVGQAGTQFDALTHPMIKITGREAQGWKDGNYMYNGVRLEDVGGPRGLTKNGPENVGSFFTRGILIDIAALKGVERLPKGYSITLADYRDALARQGIGDAEQGNVVLIRTGWDQLWKNNMAKPADQAQRDNMEANSGEPGASAEVCDHLAGRKVSVLGMDNWGIEPYDFAKEPPTLIKAWAYCHMNLITRRGIYLHENLDLEQLSADRAYEFLYAWAPLKLVGATGSPGNPIAAY